MRKRTATILVITAVLLVSMTSIGFTAPELSRTDIPTQNFLWVIVIGNGVNLIISAAFLMFQVLREYRSPYMQYYNHNPLLKEDMYATYVTATT